MVGSDIACPKCKAQMQEGYPLDSGGGPSVGTWIEGRPEYFARFFLKVGWRAKRRPITAYRCPSCGYLESYAR
jgi:hypothetical protein